MTGHAFGGLLRRVDETGRPAITLQVDGQPVTALLGDTILTALLTNGIRLRSEDFGSGARAGFCLMGACQDCWVWTESGARLRACSTDAVEGMRIITQGTPWPAPP